MIYRFRSEQGSNLVAVLMSIGIIAIIITFAVSTFNNTLKQRRVIETSRASMPLDNSVIQLVKQFIHDNPGRCNQNQFKNYANNFQNYKVSEEANARILRGNTSPSGATATNPPNPDGNHVGAIQHKEAAQRCSSNFQAPVNGVAHFCVDYTTVSQPKSVFFKADSHFTEVRVELRNLHKDAHSGLPISCASYVTTPGSGVGLAIYYMHYWYDRNTQKPYRKGGVAYLKTT